MRRADTRGIRSCLVPAFPCAWLSFSLGSSWLRESPLPSPGVPKCPTGSSKMALPWVGRCGILRISLSLPPSVPFLSLIPQLSAWLSPSTPSVCSSISFVVRHTLSTLFNLATVNTLDPSYTALLRLYHSTYHLLAHCVVYLHIMCTVYYLFQPECKFPKCRDCCLFCSPTRYFINT